MHQRYGKDGLVCMSVSVDDDLTPAVLAFLTGQNATFANYWLAERGEFWQERLNIKSAPAVFVFDRLGRRAARFDNDDPRKQYTHHDVERLTRELLRAAP